MRDLTTAEGQVRSSQVAGRGTASGVLQVALHRNADTIHSVPLLWPSFSWFQRCGAVCGQAGSAA